MMYTKPNPIESMITEHVQDAARGLCIPSHSYDEFITDCVQCVADYVDTFGALPKDYVGIVKYVGHMYGLCGFDCDEPAD